MNGRLAQDAQDTLEALEAQAFRQSEKARWAAAQPPKIVRIWAPTMEAHQRQAFERYVIENNLPF